MSSIRMPDAGFSITEGTVVKWYKGVGDSVKEGENVVAVETDKITVEIPAEAAGVLKEILFKEGDVVRVGAVMGTIGEKSRAAAMPVETIASVRTSVPGIAQGGPPPSKTAGSFRIERRISPAAKAIARQRGLDIAAIETGSGPNGRIVKKDVLAFAARQETDRSAKVGVFDGAVRAAERQPFVAATAAAAVKRVEFKGWRKAIADRMEKSSREIPRYTMSVDADVTELSDTIQKLRGKEEELHLTYLPFMMKAAVQGIREIPYVNSHCDKDGYTIFDVINIGIAVDLGEKLLVPVVKNVAGKSIRELAKELEGLVAKARTDKLEPQDIEGGTITLTNVGMFHTVSATSIIVPPQVAILYMGFARDMPAVWKGKIEIRKIMSFGATYDHRVVNGAAGGRFLLKMKECMEDIGAFLLAIR
jgi:pyruvate/2-oxoglutarate dehydrogenase complex dihydrolipoamide acyltransferase (E2) component